LAKTFSVLQSEIARLIQDTASAYVEAADIAQAIDHACSWVSVNAPRTALYHYFVESRTGTATSTTASALVDSTKAQFLAGDVGKVVYNSTDKTWAVISAYVSASQVTLSTDIMASGENYSIFNSGCVSKKQINLSDIKDYVDNGRRGVMRTEYPIGTQARFRVEGDILTLDVNSIDDSNSTLSSPGNTEVLIWVKREHYVSQLTDLVGAIDLGAGYAKGVTAIHVDGLQASGTWEEDVDFTIANRRYVYTVTADGTIAANELDLTIFPGLENAVADDVVITITGSTLTRQLETIVVKYAAGLTAISWAAQQITQAELALARVSSVNYAINDMIAPLVQAGIDISSGRTEANKVSSLVTRVTTQINEALTSLTIGWDTINKVNSLGLSVPGQYLNDAQGQLQAANELLSQARADESIAGTFAGLGARELSVATGHLQKAGGHLQELGARLNIGRAMEAMKRWGQEQMILAGSDLDNHLRSRVATTT